MPLSADPNGGGTETDGTKSSEYCSYCYRAGAFTDPDLTMEGMIAKLRPMEQAMNIPPEVVRSSIEMLPHLKRWQAKG